MSDKKTKPKYNMWQNTGYMVNLAWKNQKQVIFINVVIALLAAGDFATGGTRRLPKNTGDYHFAVHGGTGGYLWPAVLFLHGC